MNAHVSVALDDGFRFEVSGREGAGEFRRRVAHLMISIRNRAFDRALIDAFCRFASAQCRGGIVTVVDAPYLHNIRAATDDPVERARREAGLATLARERTTHALRRMARSGGGRVRFVSWSELAVTVPSWLTGEIAAAARAGGAFADAVELQSAAAVHGFADAVPVPAFVDFLIEELPVLVHAAYSLEGGVLDCYPGPQAPLLWDIDAGRFADELPRTTALARAHSGMLYAEIRRPG